jgi:hypothetical protein
VNLIRKTLGHKPERPAYLAQYFKKTNLSKMNQLNNKITGQTRKDVEVLSTKSIKSTGKRKNNPVNQGEYYELLKASIKEHGVLTPIIFDIETNQIISGKLRCHIALEVGCKYIPVVYEELEIANKIIDFYKQPKFQSPIYENYINQFVTDIQRNLSDNSPNLEETLKSIANTINYLSMSGDNAFYAFNALLYNIHFGSLAEFTKTGVVPSTLHEKYIFQFVTIVQSNFENLNQEGIKILEELANSIFHLCTCSKGVFDAFDYLLDDIYWGRIAD